MNLVFFVLIFRNFFEQYNWTIAFLLINYYLYFFQSSDQQYYLVSLNGNDANAKPVFAILAKKKNWKFEDKIFIIIIYVWNTNKIEWNKLFIFSHPVYASVKIKRAWRKQDKLTSMSEKTTE